MSHPIQNGSKRPQSSSPNGKIVGAFALAFVMLAVGAGEIPSDLEPRHPKMVETAHPSDKELYRLRGEGRFEEVIEVARNRIAARPQSCIPYLHLVKAAAQTGELEDVASELLDMRRHRPSDLFLLVGTAYAYRELRRWEQALHLLAQAVRRGVPCPHTYRSFVRLSQNRGRLSEAETILEWLLSQRPTDGYLLFARAYVWASRGFHTRALLGYQEAMLKARPLALTYYHQAPLLTAEGRHEQALSLCRAGLRVAHEDPHLDLRMELLSAMSNALELLDREEESQQVFEEAREFALEHGLDASLADFLLQRALALLYRGKTEAAIRSVSEARNYGAQLVSPDGRAFYLYQLGKVLSGLGEDASGEAAYRESVEICAAIGSTRLEWNGRLYLGIMLLDRGEREQAQQTFNQALEQSVKLESLSIRVRALSGLAATRERVGHYRQALEDYRRILELSRRGGDKRAQAMALNNIGLVYFRLGQPGPALAYVAEATRAARAVRDLRLQVGIQQGLAATLAGLGNLRESQKVYQATLRITSRLSAPSLQGLALAGWARVTLELGDPERAQQGFEEALQLARNQGNQQLVVQALSGLGLCEWRKGNLSAAASRLEETLKIVESFRERIWLGTERMSYLETRSQVFSNLAAVMLQIAAGEPNGPHQKRAFRVIERSRSRALLDILTRSRAGSGDNGPVRPDVASNRLVDAGRLQEVVLEPGELLLEYSLGEQKSYVWAISRDTFEVFELPPRRELAKSVMSFLNAIASPPRSPSNPFDRHLDSGRDLFDALLGPLKELVLEASHLIVSPDRFLHYLPFGALVMEKESKRRYLMETIPVSYVPSATTFEALRGRPVARGAPFEFLGVAQPDIIWGAASPSPGGESPTSSVRLARVPFVIDEVEALARLFPDRERRVYLNRGATERAIKQEDLRRYRILHFATHALADGVYPERSAIYLARDPQSEEDGALRMAEILKLPLASDLVVLSGCQTGLGPITSTEGIVGLPWAFLSSGCRSVVVSLWNVNDRSTSELMQFFYRHLQGGMARAAALRRAQTAMLESKRIAFRHPYYWAPFVLVGVGR